MSLAPPAGLAACLNETQPLALLRALARLQPLEGALRALGRAAAAAGRLAGEAHDLGEEDCAQATLDEAERLLLQPLPTQAELEAEDVGASLGAQLGKQVYLRVCQTLSQEAAARGDTPTSAVAAAAIYAAGCAQAVEELCLEAMELEDDEAEELALAVLDPAAQAVFAAAALSSEERACRAVRDELQAWIDGPDPLATRRRARAEASYRSPRARELAQRTMTPEALARYGFA